MRDDGRRTGVLPTLIQGDGPHPADRLPVSGLQLRSLRLDGLPTAQRDVLRLRGVGGDPAAAPRLTAVFDTPRGGVTLQTP